MDVAKARAWSAQKVSHQRDNVDDPEEAITTEGMPTGVPNPV